ncbi:MAG TPA: hypothetical protein VH375_05545, partial [Rhodanobacteraceae bacterium]
MKRILVRVLLAVVVALLIVVGFVFVRSELALRHTWQINETALAIPTDADAVARGEHIAITRGCTDCHAADFGGRVVMEA